MDIRRGRGEDAASVIDLLKQFPPEEQQGFPWQAATETFLRLVDDRDRCSIFVAEEGGRILGVITMSYPEAVRCGGPYTCIEEFIVASDGRGKGIGGKLLGAVITEARAKGCYELQVNNPSEAGYPVYLRYGLLDKGKHLKMVLATDHGES